MPANQPVREFPSPFVITDETLTPNFEHHYREEAATRLIYQNRLRALRAALAAPMPDIAALVQSIDETLYTASQLYGDTLSLSETPEHRPAPAGEDIDYAQRW